MKATLTSSLALMLLDKSVAAFSTLSVVVAAAVAAVPAAAVAALVPGIRPTTGMAFFMIVAKLLLRCARPTAE